MKQLVLTGGPGGGKSSSLSFIKERYEETGHRVFVVPEIASILLQSGVQLLGHETEQAQRANFHLQMTLRDNIVNVATWLEEQGQACIILFDRAERDNLAYLPPDLFEEFCVQFGTSSDELLGSYDGVIHLQSTAVDLPAAYSNASNPHRSEDRAAAAALDRKTLECWIDAPKLALVDNTTSWEEKLERIGREADRLLGVTNYEIERRFLIKRPDLSGLVTSTSEIEQRYLQLDDQSEVRLRRRQSQTKITYYQTEKAYTTTDGQRTEVEAIVSEDEWNNCQPLSATVPIRKTRTVVADGHIWEVDQFHHIDGLWIAEVELPSIHEQLNLPPWLEGVEVTDDHHYHNRSLATPNWQLREEHQRLLG